MEVLRSNEPYDLERLRHEVAIAEKIQGFDHGAYGHCISLPDEDDLGERYRGHHNNLPFAGAFAECTYLRQIFQSFETEKTSYRLLRRGPQTAYSLHNDKDKGVDVVRAQIPIVTSERAFLVLMREDAQVEVPVEELAAMEGDVWYDMADLDRLCGDDYELFYLEPGYLHYFDTNEIHTLINADLSERVTLCIDLVLNDWLRGWIASHLGHRLAPVANPRSPALRWEWNALRHGIIRNEEYA
ncbi:MAG: hypothetical protein AAF657_17140 [Acidobacteriota bacterium]